MGGTGGTSAIYSIVNGQTVQIPLPTDGSLVDSVLLYNYSPFLIQVRIGTANAWLSAWMVERITLGNASGVACTAVQPVGGASASSTGSITAAFILKGDDLSDVGTYPAPLFHVAQFLDVYYPDGDIAIGIGPGQQINFYDDVSGDITITLIPGAAGFTNDSNTAQVQILSNGAAGAGNFPGVYFLTSTAPGVYNQPAWIQANPDSNGNPQLGINNGLYTSSATGDILRQRMFMGNDVESQLGAIVAATQALVGGQLLWGDTTQQLAVYSAASALQNFLTLQAASTSSQFPIQVGAWTNITLANGWSNFGAPYSNAQARIASDGFVHLRGLLTTGTRTDGTIIGTLPAGMLPPTQKYLSTTSNVANLSASNPQIVVDTAGNLKIFGISAYSIAVQIVLDGLLFESNAYMA